MPEKSKAASSDYCPGCGRSEYAGITHVCPPLEARPTAGGPTTWTTSTVPTTVTEVRLA